jgi:hypothetical protein
MQTEKQRRTNSGNFQPLKLQVALVELIVILRSRETHPSSMGEEKEESALEIRHREDAREGEGGYRASRRSFARPRVVKTLVKPNCPTAKKK